LLLIPILLSACSKDQVELLDNSKTSTKVTLENISSQQVVERLLSFKDAANRKASGQMLKTASEYSVEEASWYLEAALNFHFRHTPTQIENRSLDSTLITIANFTYNQDGQLVVNENDVTAAYNNLEQYLLSVASDPEDVIEVVDVYVDHVNNYTVTFGVNTLIINGNTYTPQPLAMGPNDHWKAHWDLGKCDGTFVNQRDGHDVIADHIRFNYQNNFLLAYTNQNAVEFYTNVVTISDSPWGMTDMGGPTNPCTYGDCSQFFGHINDPNGHIFPNDYSQCLTPQELTNYYNGTLLWVYTAQATLAQGIGAIPAAQRDLIDIRIGAYHLLSSGVIGGGTEILSARFGTAHTF
jgi:hypothetical protein